HATSSQFYEIVLPSGKKVTPPEGRCWAVSQSRFEELRNDNRIWFGINGDGRPRFKNYLSESEGSTAWSWWTNKEVGHNQEAKNGSISLLGESASFANPQPDKLLQRIIHSASNEKDVVHDLFTGPATTLGVAQKMKRRYIGIGQMDYINAVSV